MKAEDIFLTAVDQKTLAQRQAYLESACGGDADLRAQVEGLLRSHEEAGSFLNAPLFDSPPTVDGAAPQVESQQEPDEILLDFLVPTTAPDSLGRIGPYEVTETIGRGGMGIVLKARDTKLNRVVAIKVMAPELATNPTARKRFQREAHAAAAVVHQHVVTIHAVDEDRLPYLVMECIHGQSLQEKIDHEGHLKLVEILRIGQQIASGLAAAHTHGLMHRDVKPANILLENGVERVRITDFGLARAVDDVGVTRTGEVAGTPQYMSPEQVQGLPMDARSDLFSLGCVLYAMCTGRSPFRAETTFATVRRVCEDSPRPIREVNPEIPQWLVEIIDRLLAKQPAERFQSAAEVGELLGRRLAEVQHPSFVTKAIDGAANPKPVRQSVPHRRHWANAAAAVLVLLVGGLSMTEATGVTRVVPTVIRIVTGEGTLVVETESDVRVTLEGNGDLTFNLAGGQTIRVPSGRYRVKATRDGEPIPLESEVVSIAKGDRQVVRVKLEAPSRVPGASKDPPPSAIAPFDEATAKQHQEAWAKHVGLPVEFTNSVGMKFRLIPPGEFEMGSTPRAIEAARAADKYSDDQAMSDALNSEGPIHKVILSEPFYLSVTEVTQEEFETVTGQNPSSFRPGGANAGKVSDVETSQLPVHGISWNDGADFCSRLSSREGLAPNYRPVGTAVEMLPGNGYRLPREAQWEFACRAGTTTTFWFGDQAADHAKWEWLVANSAARPHTVGSLAANPFGLFDMHGNVSEWCQDGWNPEFYLQFRGRVAVDPLSKPAGPHQHMVRGGAWTSEPAVRGRSAFRMPAVPSKRYESNGFRVALAVESGRQVIDRLTKSPFVLLAAGKESGFGTLAEAVEAAGDGDTIEVRGNGPFVSQPISIDRTALAIRAGKSFRPIIKLSPAAQQQDIALLYSNAALVLEGLELQRAFTGDPYTRVWAALKIDHAPLMAANCRFRAPVWSDHSPICILRNCEFLSVTAPYRGQFGPGARVRFENCVHRGTRGQIGIGLFYDDPAEHRDIVLQAQRCTFLNGTPWWIPYRGGLPEASQPMRLEVTQCIFDCSNAVALSIRNKADHLERAEAEEMLRRRVQWQGERNLYAGGSTSVLWQTDSKAQPPHGPKSLEDWKEFWSRAETDSQQGTPQFRGGNLRARDDDSVDQLSPGDFRLREGSPGYKAGKDGQDLGADVALVGPGEAYKVWKQTPDYREWLNEAEQLKELAATKPKPGEFVVLGGASVAERNFDTLAEAVRRASNGDTIEIRGDGPFVTDAVTIGKRLVIRAGEGYSPTITLSQAAAAKNIPLLTMSASLVLEGLELRRVDGAEGEFEGRYPMLLRAWDNGELSVSNCRFVLNAPGDKWTGMIVAGSLVCTVRNSQFIGGFPSVALSWNCSPGGRGTMENCISGVGNLLTLNVRDSDITDASIQVRHNTMVGNGLSLDFYHVPKPAGNSPIRLDFSANATHCIGSDGCALLRVGQIHLERSLAAREAEDLLHALVDLHEERNVYTTGTRMLHHGRASQAGFSWLVASQAKDLADWNRFWTQTGTGSMEGDVRFEGGDLLQRTLTNPQQLTPGDFRVPEGSAGYRAGPDGKDLGADVELVGPGEAYKRWRQKAEYQQWLLESGQKKGEK